MAQRSWKSQVQSGRRRSKKRYRSGARATAGYRIGSVAAGSFFGKTFMMGVSRFGSGQEIGGS